MLSLLSPLVLPRVLISLPAVSPYATQVGGVGCPASTEFGVADAGAEPGVS
jgi:hypothetical protein